LTGREANDKLPINECNSSSFNEFCRIWPRIKGDREWERGRFRFAVALNLMSD
jgi:hypothetical protein